MKEQQLPKIVTRYRAFIVDLQEGKYKDMGIVYDSHSAAQDALKAYFDKNPPQSVVSYDIGGYTEEVHLKCAYNPKTNTFYDNDDDESN